MWMVKFILMPLGILVVALIVRVELRRWRLGGSLSLRSAVVACHDDFASRFKDRAINVLRTASVSL